MIKGVTHIHLGPIWFHSEPLEAPISQTSIWSGTFCGHAVQQYGSSSTPVVICCYIITYSSFLSHCQSTQSSDSRKTVSKQSLDSFLYTCQTVAKQHL